MSDAYSFLITNAEAYSFYIAFAIYLTITVVIISRYLSIIRNKKLDKKTAARKKRKIYFQTCFSLIACAVIHTITYHILFGKVAESPLSLPIKRGGYYLSILITMSLFALLIWFGMYLKGTSTLPKQKGPVTGV